MVERGFEEKRLTKPLTIRWSTTRIALLELLQYASIFPVVHSDSADQETQRLVTKFSTSLELHRVAGILVLLTMTYEVTLFFQQAVVTIPMAIARVKMLREQINSLTLEELNSEIKNTLRSCGRNSNEDHSMIIAAECLQLSKELDHQLFTRFTSTTESDALDFISHDVLMSPNTREGDLFIETLGIRFRQFIHFRLYPHVVVHWHHLKAVYQANFGTQLRTTTTIIDLLLTDSQFSSCTAILPIIKIVQIASSTTVETEREFSFLHFTKRKERARLQTDHLQILTRIHRNAPRILSDQEVNELYSEDRDVVIQKQKRIESASSNADVIFDDSSSESSSPF
ncbi:hypothetical protein BLNAU_24449 [Blattamonas nauphoetae]|uniref:HAT C-terminal dimerisation domain-containing protein n=1 Tax=Blattamonas nauphoetae TaxID=2049346 RepID=A0ABQ9WME6_9EUKA|nr:hypothetical protein BLNAU_24449 [Blattamonas nauphoetae]